MNFKKSSGLSLMELLVVLVIVGFVSVMLVQGATFLFANFNLVSLRYEKLKSNGLPEQWYRSSVAGLVVSNERPFLGGTNYFEGYTLSPITPVDGVLTKIRWSLRTGEDWVDLYVRQNNKDEILIMRWTGQEARFKFVNELGEAQEQWPLTEKNRKLIPSAILLEVVKDRYKISEILASTELKRFAGSDYRDLL
jgi:hypothetical protein